MDLSMTQLYCLMAFSSLVSVIHQSKAKMAKAVPSLLQKGDCDLNEARRHLSAALLCRIAGRGRVRRKEVKRFGWRQGGS
ncbi:hypothetical protein BCV69DRAFT_199006 [Microstroma glucosiphilum]|uniref:Uncharacterized protein n=1 Tax=Pseudomicrostroma glucosiphilum TaxID=1684307 RepID=A0A316U695_9BASI|nr:hypothetical protein BCV69DRAFT_199006 [Pseudomicrostroma glucosiphilum]PWN20766.1 hypothetical protein BCV69DRAFT_199006 [Pseudomicrostroma glucosiphilum]